MLRNRLYYSVKPLIPQAARLAVRRRGALAMRRTSQNVWPILPGSERPPAHWPGWPEGKKFALVLTHDVEGSSGLAKIPQVMELESKLGFRSSFNLIPEGEYRVTAALRQQIRDRGFEVGVHDLYHDGKLFLSEKEFRRNVPGINQHLKEWGASGFRSAFMLHNLSWIHGLDVQYDASTFDTDPFEPQPHGQHTIFPFWVPAPVVSGQSSVISRQSPGVSRQESDPLASSLQPSALGYAELPYTLPQDSTLFLLLNERHPDIWFQKLDWIAQHGGMALVNVHPDYMRFEGEPASATTYPVDMYIRFLEHARKRYGDTFWQPLPHELARFVKQARLEPPRNSRRVCMITHSHFLSDARVSRYAEALAERGDHVDVLALQRSPDQPREERFGNITLHHIQERFGKKEKSSFGYLLPILRFLVVAAFRSARAHRKERYDLFHVHNIPDFLVFAAWFPRLTGARVILDIHDIVPEFFASKFGVKENSPAIKLLKASERASAAIADHVIIANDLWLDKYAARVRAHGKCSVFINNVDAEVFSRREKTRRDGKLIILFPGGLQWHQGLDIAIRAFQQVSTRLPQAEFHIYGDGNMKPSLVQLTKELGLQGKVLFFDPLSVRKIAEIMANADLGVVPKRADSFGNEAYSTKIMEFMSLGVPVVISSTKIDRFYFDDSVVRFFPSGDIQALSEAMLQVLQDAPYRETLVANAQRYAGANNWDSRKGAYLQIVDDLIEHGRHLPSPAPVDHVPEAAAATCTPELAAE